MISERPYKWQSQWFPGCGPTVVRLSASIPPQRCIQVCHPKDRHPSPPDATRTGGWMGTFLQNTEGSRPSKRDMCPDVLLRQNTRPLCYQGFCCIPQQWSRRSTGPHPGSSSSGAGYCLRTHPESSHRSAAWRTA